MRLVKTSPKFVEMGGLILVTMWYRPPTVTVSKSAGSGIKKELVGMLVQLLSQIVVKLVTLGSSEPRRVTGWIRVTGAPPVGVGSGDASCGLVALAADASTTVFKMARAQNAATTMKADRIVRTVDLV